MVCWLVGGKCVKGKLSQTNNRQFQTLPNIKPIPIQTISLSIKTIPGVPRRLWPSLRRSIILRNVLIDPLPLNMKPPLLTFLTWTDSSRHFQTSNWTNRSHFPINQKHPRHLWPNFKKSNILTFFEIGQVTLTPRGSIGNFPVGLNH